MTAVNVTIRSHKLRRHEISQICMKVFGETAAFIFSVQQQILVGQNEMPLRS